MRILHIFDHSIPLHSGYAFRSLAILKEQRKLGLETEHLTSIKHYISENAEDTEDAMVFSRTFPTWRSRFPLLNQWDVIYTLERAIVEKIKKSKIDIIHAHSPSLNALAAAKVAKKFNIPFVYEMRASWEDAAVSHGTCTENSVRYKVGQWLEKKALLSADHVVTICEGLQNQIVKWGVQRENITVVPNAVDINKFDLLDEKDNDLLDNYKLHGKTVLGFLGSFYRYEGLHILIEALTTIIEKNPKVVLFLVGGGQEEEALAKQVKALSLGSHVIFSGRVAHEEIAKYYRLVDIFIYPRESIRLTELVTPLKPLEAMAQHGLVVASNIGGHREMIEHDKNGILFEPNSPTSLAQAVNHLLAKRDSWDTLKLAGREYIEKERCWSKSVNNIIPVYQKLLSSNKS